MKRILRVWIRAVVNRIRFPRSTIGSDCNIAWGTTIGRATRLGERCFVFRSTVGGQTHLGDHTVVEGGCRLLALTAGAHCRFEEDSAVFRSRLEGCNGIQPGCYVNDLTMGRHSYVGRGSYLNDVSVGSFTSIGPHCILGTGEHPVDQASTCPVFYSSRGQSGPSFVGRTCFAERSRISIGNDVWLGARVFVRDGVKVGDGAIVAAGAVVVGDIPDYAIFGGVPAKLIRYRYPEEIRERLCALKWWTLGDDTLRDLQPLFVANDVEALLTRLSGKGRVPALSPGAPPPEISCGGTFPSEPREK